MRTLLAALALGGPALALAFPPTPPFARHDDDPVGGGIFPLPSLPYSSPSPPATATVVVVAGTPSAAALSDNLTVAGYAPERVACANGTVFVRPADEIHPAERAFVDARLADAPFAAYLASISLSPADLNLLSSANYSANGTVYANASSSATEPIIALAFSGGGVRALLSGAGQLAALSPANPEARAAGTAFGPAVAYVAGLSGGGWLTASAAVWAGSAQTLSNDSTSAGLDASGVVGGWNLSAVGLREGAADDIVQAVDDKRAAGYPVGLTDVWGLALGAHLFPPVYAVGAGTPNLTFSDLQALDPLAFPYPIVIAAERAPGQQAERVLANATIYEFTPYEFGTWAFAGGFGNASLFDGGAFTPEQYLGTALENGRPNATDADGKGQCTVGFDNAAFVVGASSTLFNVPYAVLANSSSSGSSRLSDQVQSILSNVSAAGLDVARVPSPFINFRATTNPRTNDSTLDLVDAGLTGQNVPLEPVLAPARGVDAIVAFDNSADTEYNWPNGSALAATQRRYADLRSSLVAADITPSPGPLFLPTTPTTAAAFLNANLTTRPVFFGCSADPTPSERDVSVPLVISIPNYPWSAWSNTSTLQLEYDDQQAAEVFANGIRTLTLNGTLGLDYAQCLACALADRAVVRAGNARSALCTDCFATWCWSTPPNDTLPSADATAPILGTVPPFIQALNGSAGPALAGSEGVGVGPVPSVPPSA